MSELRFYGRDGGRVAIALSFSLDALLENYETVRRKMIRERHPDFTRTEWAYLIRFLEAGHLSEVFHRSFGPESGEGIPIGLLRPRERVGLWLPNNVSLLGPLAVVLISLTGAHLSVKIGSRGRDLCGAFVEYLASRSSPGPLAEWLRGRVSVAVFDRIDPRNAEMASSSDVRILFGGDEAAKGIEALSHPTSSRGFYFTHRVSEAWIEPSEASRPDTVESLVKIFSIYGQAGCTSPQRIMLVGGKREDAVDLARKMEMAWESAALTTVDQHQASQNFLGLQWARANGFESRIVGNNAALLVLAPAKISFAWSNLGIELQWGNLEDAISTAAPNLQTIGYALRDPFDTHYTAALARSQASRFVPLAQMHDFGPVWDGEEWWSQLFTRTSFGSG